MLQIQRNHWVEFKPLKQFRVVLTYQLLGGGLRAPSVSTLTSSSPSLASTVQERSPVGQLTIQSGMKAICSSMQRSDSGLEVRDRMWLKINIPQAFIGNYSVIL